MKRHPVTRLQLKRTTVALLETARLAQIVGGFTSNYSKDDNCSGSCTCPSNYGTCRPCQVSG